MGYSLILNTYDKITSDICEIPIGDIMLNRDHIDYIG